MPERGGVVSEGEGEGEDEGEDEAGRGCWVEVHRLSSRRLHGSAGSRQQGRYRWSTFQKVVLFLCLGLEQPHHQLRLWM
jgi:hypothetical protein